MHKEISTFVAVTMQVRFLITDHKESNTLPFHLLSLYSFYRVTILNRPCVLLVAKDPDVQPVAISNHVEDLKARRDEIYIFSTKKLSLLNREKLIRMGVPFIVPWQQIYLPFMGVLLSEDLKERLDYEESIGLPNKNQSNTDK